MTHHTTSKWQNQDFGQVHGAPLTSSVPSLSIALLLSVYPVWPGHPGCPGKARVGWLRPVARGSPHLPRDGFQILPEGGLLILLSLGYKRVVTLSGMPIPILRNGSRKIQKMKSQKRFITLSTKTGICRQRHRIIGECSLTASSSVALGNLWRPQVVKKPLGAETQCLCVETNAEASMEVVISPLCCVLPTAHSPTHQVANARVWALVPAPNSPVVCLWLPSSDTASLSPLWSHCTHGFPIQPLPVLRTPHCSVHLSAPCGQCPREAPTDKMKDKILKPTGRLAFFIHTLADGSNQMQEKSSLGDFKKKSKS